MRGPASSPGTVPNPLVFAHVPTMNPPPPTLFAVELRSPRWEPLVAWYRDVLGLKVLLRVIDDRYALLAAGGSRLAILGRDEPAETNARVTLCFEVTCLDTARSTLAAAGNLTAEPVANPEGFRELIVTDPDGNRLRLFAWTHDRPAERSDL